MCSLYSWPNVGQQILGYFYPAHTVPSKPESKSAPSYCGKTQDRNVQLIFTELAVNLVVYVKSILRAHLFLPFSNYNKETRTGSVA